MRAHAPWRPETAPSTQGCWRWTQLLRAPSVPKQVLATAESPERSDARVLRIVLSLMGVHDRLERAGLGGLQARTASCIGC